MSKLCSENDNSKSCSQNPWETEAGKKIWKSESEYFACVRGLLRMAWTKYPLRNEWKNSKLKIVDEASRSEFGFSKRVKRCGQCSLCHKWFPGSKLEVDHKAPSSGCKNYTEAEEFLWYCVGGVGDDWQLTCKPCHKVKTYAERGGLSFNDAVLEKKVIKWVKEITAKDQKEFLTKLKLPSTNDKIRRESYRNYLRSNLND